MFEVIVFPGIIFFGGFLLGLFIILWVRQEDFKDLFAVFTLAFLLRAALSILFFIGSDDGFMFKNDGWTYHYNAWTILQLQKQHVVVTSTTFYGHSASGTISNYDFWTAFIYSITGKSPLSLFLLNTMAGSLSVILIYFIARDLFGKRVAVLSSFISALWPSLIMWSTQNFKEPVTNLALCAFVWSCIRLREGFNHFFIFFIAMIACALFVFAQLRYFVIPIVGASVFLWWIVSSKHWGTTKGIMYNLFCIFIMIVVLYSTQLSTIIIKETVAKIENEKLFSSIVSFVDFSRSIRAFGNTAIMPNYNFDSPVSLVSFAPIGIIYAWLSPFPWQSGGAAQKIALPEMAIFYILLPYTISGFIFSIRNKIRKSYLLIYIIAGITLLLGYFEGNVGTLFRHRSLMLYFIFVFTAVGIVYSRKKIQWELNTKQP